MTLRKLFEFIDEVDIEKYEFWPTALLSMKHIENIHPARILGIYKYVMSRNRDKDWSCVIKSTFDN